MKVAQIGNFEPTYSTENELKDALERNGYEVWPIQEGEADQLDDLITTLRTRLDHGLDFILWTRTADLAQKVGHAMQWELLAEARRAEVEVVGYHLDRWWGLKRQTDVYMPIQPFFQIDMLFTADGAHQTQWGAIGANHTWLLPGISERWCQLGVPKPEYETDVLFVGSWRGYHREWQHRQELIANLSTRYGERFRVIPGPNEPAVRGLELNDVYASAKVVVGDSCLVPTSTGHAMHSYCSDRVPETLGRGGILLHPEVYGVTHDGGFEGAPNLFTWELGDWADLYNHIDDIINDTTDDHTLREAGMKYIKAHHSYTSRIETMLHHIAAKRDGWL